jgi:hypothetical protein
MSQKKIIRENIKWTKKTKNERKGSFSRLKFGQKQNPLGLTLDDEINH